MAIQVNHDVLFSLFQFLDPMDVENMARACSIEETDAREDVRRAEIPCRAILFATRLYYSSFETQLSKSLHIQAWTTTLQKKTAKQKGGIEIHTARIRVQSIAIGAYLYFEDRSIEEILSLLRNGDEKELESFNRDLGKAMPPLSDEHSNEDNTSPSQETLPFSP